MRAVFRVSDCRVAQPARGAEVEPTASERQATAGQQHCYSTASGISNRDIWRSLCLLVTVFFCPSFLASWLLLPSKAVCLLCTIQSSWTAATAAPWALKTSLMACERYARTVYVANQPEVDTFLRAMKVVQPRPFTLLSAKMHLNPGNDERLNHFHKFDMVLNVMNRDNIPDIFMMLPELLLRHFLFPFLFYHLFLCFLFNVENPCYLFHKNTTYTLNTCCNLACPE